MKTYIRLALIATLLSGASAVNAQLPYPILFVTQVPIPGDFTSVNATFGNHLAGLELAGRGGDLWIRYPNGALKNLTAAAGYGQSGMQGAKAIAVRDPAVHWNGKKALFSMAIGAPTTQWGSADDRFYWQLYEITGLGKNDTPIITKVAKQPANYNNISPLYSPNGGIIFTSDRPRDGQAHLYPQRDEYELAPTVTGLWQLNPQTGALQMLTHAPSGDFNPIVDSYGRILFTRWDHLQQDQFASADRRGENDYGTFNYASEAAGAKKLNSNKEVFPEPLGGDPTLAGTHFNGHSFNHFFPWQVNPDGTELETLNHVGRHELHGYFDRSFNDDPALQYHFITATQFNQNPINNFFQIKEDPSHPGIYYGIDAPEFSTHASGQIIKINGSPQTNADNMKITYVTHRDTASYTDDNATPSPKHSGLYRDPVKLSDGTLLAAHTFETHRDSNIGTTLSPKSRYAYRLRNLKKSGSVWIGDTALTPGISKDIKWWNTSVGKIAAYSGQLWELQPVEVRPRPKPPARIAALPTPEQQVLAEENVAENALRKFLRNNGLALLVMRNLTTRDGNDKQQPFNLYVAGSNTHTDTGNGKAYDIAHLQFFQGDQIRGWTGSYSTTIQPGRRVLAKYLHNGLAQNVPDAGGPQGSVKIAGDGSAVALVPAQRALTWQTTAPNGEPVVRERNWLSFQRGEIRVCASCHGINSADQIGKVAPINKPDALRELLAYLKQQGKL